MRGIGKMGFDVNEGWKILGAVVLAMAGGFVRICMRHDDKPMEWHAVAKEMIISGFAGAMIFFLIGGYFQGDGYMVSFLCGMAGYTAPYTLDFLSRKFREITEGKK